MNKTNRATRALAHLGDTDPALAVLALWCRHVDDPGSTRTHGITIYYGPTFATLGLAEQVGTLAHHVLHVALRHSDRQAELARRLGATFDPVLYGMAADGIVNQTLLLADHALPRPAVLLTELLDNIGDTTTSTVEALRDWDADRLAMYLHSDAQRAEKARKYGRDRDFEIDLQTGDLDVVDGSQTAGDWRNHLIRALEAGRKAGTGIGRFGPILADMSVPETPWEVHLRGLLTRAVTNSAKITHRRPARRWIAMCADATARGAPVPVFEPGQTRHTLRPRIVVGLDTSSSIDAQSLSLFRNETEGVSRRTGAEIHLLAFDEEVHTQQRIDCYNRPWPRTDMRIGGGTAYDPVIAAATSLHPSILIMLTDLDASTGPAPPFPVLWAVPGTSPVVPPFGRLLRIGN